MQPGSDVIDYETMCNTIASGLTTGDLKQIKFLLRDQIGRAILERITDGRDLIQILEKREYFTRKNVEKLKKLLMDAKVEILAGVVRQYSNEIEELGSGDICKNYSTYSMTRVQNFVETENFLKMEEIINRTRAVLVKGAPGSGKSQCAFHYANKFRRDNKHSIVWKIHCTTMEEMHLSYANLMLRLSIRDINCNNEQFILECTKKMFKRVYEKLTNEQYKKWNHLIIMDDMESPNQAKYIHDMLEYFIIAENIYVIATSLSQFSPVIEFQYGMEMNGMLEPEVNELFLKDGNVGHEDEETEKNEIRLLAKNLDYLPLCLALASSYIRKTRCGIAKYNASWSELQKQAHDIAPEGKQFDAAYDLTLRKLEKDLPKHARNLLKYVTHINHTVIPIQLLESLLETDSTTKEADVNTFLAVLCDYSLATISGRGDNRVISIHSVTVWILDKKKTEDEKHAERLYLLRHFCYYIDNDARLVETMNRNVRFLEHACWLLKGLQTYRDPCFETILFECYLSCSVAITFQLYGNAQLSADHFFKKAKKLMFQMISYATNETENLDVTEEPICNQGINEVLYGNEDVRRESETMLSLLVQKSDEIQTETIKKFVLMKFRSTRDIRLLLHYGKLSNDELPGNQIPEHVLQKLINSNVIIPLENIKKMFLVELLVTILYNYSKNICFMEENNDEENEGQQTVPFSIKALKEYQYALNLASHLEISITSIHAGSQDNHSVKHVLTKRGGISCFLLRKIKNIATIKEIISIMDEMNEGCKREFYVDFGVLKMCHSYNLYQRCMIQNILRSCCLSLSGLIPSEKEDHIQRARGHTDEMEGILSEMEPWIIPTSLHLDIAETYMAVVPPQADKAMHHLKRALEKPELPTRYTLKVYKSFVRFCLHQGTENDFKFAEDVCEELLQQSTQQEPKDFLLTSLEQLLQKKCDRQIKNTQREEGEEHQADAACMTEELPNKDIPQRGGREGTNRVNTEPVHAQETLDGSENTCDQLNISSIEEERLSVDKQRSAIQRERLEIEQERLKIDKEQLEIEKERLKDEEEPLEIEEERMKDDKELLETDKE